MFESEDPQAPTYREEWVRRRMRMRLAGWFVILWVALIALLVTLFLAEAIHLPEKWGIAFIPAFFLPVLCYTLFAMIIQRCPRCAKQQTRIRNPRFCFNCGLRLRE